MKRLKSAIVALSETRLIAEIENSEMNISGYSIIRCDAENRNTEGTILYIKYDVKYEILLTKKMIRIAGVL